MDYIYTRVSTEAQTTQNQVLILSKQYPDAEVVEEVGSGAKERPKLTELLDKMVAGDRLIVYAIDRLGRSMLDLVNLFELLGSRKIILVSQREGVIDRDTPMGNFMYHIMAAMANMERDILKERIAAGLARTKAKGTKLGRKYTHRKEIRELAVLMRQEGKSLQQISNDLGISIGAIRGYL